MTAVTDHLDPAAYGWLADPALRRLFKVLNAGGYEARAVGGAVRDTLLGRAIGDIDLAVNAAPDVVTQLLAADGIKVVPTGIEHGTVTAVIDHRGFELTSLRRDVATDGRHATVAFTDDWQLDAARRDFTFNALYLAADGQLFDYFDGRHDLGAGRVRFIGDAAARIHEDVLRILRFFRFHAWFGQGEADAAGLQACRDLAQLIPRLSIERVWRELVKLLAASDPLPALQLMQHNSVLQQVLPETTGFDRLAALLRAESVQQFPAQPLTRLAALLPGAQVENVAKRLKLSGREAGGLTALAKLPALLAADLDRLAVRRALYAHGVDAVSEALPLVAADHPQLPLAAARQLCAAWEQPPLPLQGADLIKLGLPPGPRMGTILREVEQWWIGQDFRPDHAACLQQARQLIDR